MLTNRFQGAQMAGMKFKRVLGHRGINLPEKADAPEVFSFQAIHDCISNPDKPDPYHNSRNKIRSELYVL